MPALWIKNYPTNTAWTSQKEKEENNPQTHGIFIFYDPKNLYLKKDKWESLDEYISRQESHRQFGPAVVLYTDSPYSVFWAVTQIYIVHQIQSETKSPFFDLFFITKIYAKIEISLIRNLNEIK